MLEKHNTKEQVTNVIETCKIRYYSGIAELRYEIQESKPISCVIHENKIYVLLMDETLIEVSIFYFDATSDIISHIILDSVVRSHNREAENEIFSYWHCN